MRRPKFAFGLALSFVFLLPVLVHVGEQIPAPSSSELIQTGSATGHAKVGVYLTSYAMLKEDVLRGVLEARRSGKIDTLVINVKNMHGEITYASSVPLARQIGAATGRLDFHRLIPILRAQGFYLIARQVLFYDPLLSQYLGTGEDWVRPDVAEAVAYNLAIAEEVSDFGFDEIQFDYVRYPDGGDYVPDYEPRYEAVNAFLAAAMETLGDRVVLSADLFGRVLWPWNAKRIDPIGQSLEDVSTYLDFISPMVYPSHYTEQSYKDDPYLTVHDALVCGTSRIETPIRPFLQAFDRELPDGMTLQTYIREQIRAAEEAGADGYLFWNPASDYTALFDALN